MIRFDLYLEEEQIEELKKASQREKRSVAFIIREAIDCWNAMKVERFSGATKPVSPSGLLTRKQKREK